MPATLLATHRVEKPWGRHELRAPFRAAPANGEPVGEIWFQAPGDAAPDLLIKYLFTSEKLSVQVHPDDEQAHARGLPRGKDECWLILGAEPGSTIALGTKAPVERDRLRAAALDGSIEQLLDWKPVKAGDFFYVPSGTVHAIVEPGSAPRISQHSSLPRGNPRACACASSGWTCTDSFSLVNRYLISRSGAASPGA